MAKCLVQALADPGAAFIYVDKYGVHLPYENKTPPGRALYPARHDGSRASKLVAAYKNAVRWNVNNFFRHILADLDLSGVAMIYTADHGQSLLERGYSISHCSVGPDIVIGEALVPMAVIIGEHPLRAALRATAVQMRDRASHFDIFPTLLVMLGYDRTEVAPIHGVGLLGDPCQGRRFLSGFKTSAHWVDAASAFPLAFHPPPGSQAISRHQ